VKITEPPDLANNVIQAGLPRTGTIVIREGTNLKLAGVPASPTKESRNDARTDSVRTRMPERSTALDCILGFVISTVIQEVLWLVYSHVRLQNRFDQVLPTKPGKSRQRFIVS
jgi:hypothetical protein